MKLRGYLNYTFEKTLIVALLAPMILSVTRLRYRRKLLVDKK